MVTKCTKFEFMNNGWPYIIAEAIAFAKKNALRTKISTEVSHTNDYAQQALLESCYQNLLADLALTDLLGVQHK